MPPPSTQIFRDEGVDRQSSPEQLDQLVELVRPRHWLLLAGLVLVVAAAVLWAVAGRIPVALSGRGILLAPGEGAASDGGAAGRVETAAVAPAGEASPSVCRAFFAAAEGKRLAPGMAVQVVPEAVEPGRFGAISGRVREVSRMPVSRETVAGRLGGQDLAAWLIAEPPAVEVVIELERDPGAPSGLRWTTSGGPPGPVPSGATAAVRAVVERRAPIAYLLPFLRSAGGLD